MRLHFMTGCHFEIDTVPRGGFAVQSRYNADLSSATFPRTTGRGESLVLPGPKLVSGPSTSRTVMLGLFGVTGPEITWL